MNPIASKSCASFVSLQLLLAWVGFAPIAYGNDDLAPYDARVIRVVDGDTIVVQRAQQKERIRLAQIDAPESRQPYGKDATRALTDLIQDELIRVEPVTRDRYGRWVAEISLDSTNINAQLVAEGHSWVYRRYAVDPGLDRLEDEARSARRGLWALPESERLPPWVWRASRREAKATSRREDDTSRPAACLEKHSCGEMASCSEAMFFLQKCGLTRLDGDRDGIPCEALCDRRAGEPEG
jgi:endonuclease YncB( thermonuclease family)